MENDILNYSQNRELSWLKFNQRVLQEAQDITVPLLERMKFVAIFSSNLDEFFMIRVGSLFDMAHADAKAKDSRSGLTPDGQLEKIFEAVAPLCKERDKTYSDIQKLLHPYGVCGLSYKELEQQEKKYVKKYFKDQILPILSPQIVDDQWYTAEYPYLYLRLQCEQEGVRYFSNILGFAADNLKEAVDQGGTRGGGTSVTNPPNEPELKPGENENTGTAGNNTSSGPETGENAGTAETTGNSISSGPETGENSETAETTGNNISSGSETGENPGTTGTTENSPASGPKTEETVEATGNIGTTSSSGPGAGENETAGNAEDASPSGPETEETATIETAGTVEAAGTTGNSPSPVTGASAIEAVPGSAFGRTFAIAAGFAGLSAAVGATGFCVHAGLFRRLLQAAGRLFR